MYGSHYFVKAWVLKSKLHASLICTLQISLFQFFTIFSRIKRPPDSDLQRFVCSLWSALVIVFIIFLVGSWGRRGLLGGLITNVQYVLRAMDYSCHCCFCNTPKCIKCCKYSALQHENVQFPFFVLQRKNQSIVIKIKKNGVRLT